MPDPHAKTPHHPAAASGFGDKDDHIIERRSLRDYYIILRERLWIALPVAVIVAAGYAYSQARKPQMFRASAAMEFTPPERVVNMPGVTDPSIQSDADLRTQIQALQLNSLKTRVFNSFTKEEIQVLQQPYLKDLPTGASPPNGLDLLGNVMPQHRLGTYFVDVTVSHRGSDAAALVANRFVDQYIRSRTDDLSSVNEDATQLLKSSITQVKAELDKAKAELNKYITDNKLTDLGGATGIATSRLTDASKARDTALKEVEQLTQQEEQLTRYLNDNRDRKEPKDRIDHLMELSWVANYGSVRAFNASLAETNRNLNAALGIMLEKAPPVIALVDEQIQGEQRLEQEQARAIQNFRNDLTRAKNNLAAREADFAERTRESLELVAKATRFDGYQSAIKGIEDNYNSLLTQQSSHSIVSNTQKVSLRPRDKALPGYLYEPNIQSIVRTAIGLGLVIFFGVAVGLSFVDDRIKSAWDVEHFIGVNLLGIVPDLSALKDEDKYTLVFNNRQVPGTEAFLSVYSAVKIHSKLDFPKALLITSTIPGEGKTLISCNLAGSFARHGKRTLLIDCDLRRPMVHRYFKQENTRGIITWYDAGAKLEGNLAQDPSLGIIKLGDNFSLMCSGGRSKSPTDILESPAFGQLIAALKKEYDLVVIDSPPLGAVTDSLLIAEFTDEVIYVCRFNRAYRKHIRLYIKALRNGKNEILGVVLNGLSPRRIEYYSNYRYYRSYKKYYGAQT